MVIGDWNLSWSDVERFLSKDAFLPTLAALGLALVLIGLRKPSASEASRVLRAAATLGAALLSGLFAVEAIHSDRQVDVLGVALAIVGAAAALELCKLVESRFPDIGAQLRIALFAAGGVAIAVVVVTRSVSEIRWEMLGALVGAALDYALLGNHSLSLPTVKLPKREKRPTISFTTADTQPIRGGSAAEPVDVNN
jgi:hypothetical protein